MKQLFFIKGSITDQVTYYHLLAFVITLPFDRFYSELCLVSLCLHTLIHLRKEQVKRGRLSVALVPAAIYLLTLAGTAYTSFHSEAFYEWERQLAMLLFPLVILYNPFDFKRYTMNILLALAGSCFVTIIYLYYNAFTIIRFNHLPLSSIFSNAFINHNFSAPIDMHATYFSMYIALAAVALICAVMGGRGTKEKIAYGLMLLVLLAGLVQLSSRSVFIAFAVIINLVIPFLFLERKARLRFCVAAVICSLSVFYGLTRIDNLKTRFIVDLKEDLTQAGINNNTLEPRAVRWQCGIELVRRSPVYGYGSGSEVALLKDIYFQKKLYNSYINELNAHNQYLSMLIKTGIPGLLVLLYVFFAGFKNAARSRNVAFASFLVILAVVSFSENTLDANKGIFFFAFFYALFYMPGKKGFATEDTD